MTTPDVHSGDVETASLDPDRWQRKVAAGDLLEPTRERWSVLRGGVVNLWEFDCAEFWYADGRAQFVGVNQSGKSTLMTLTSLILLAGDLDRGLIDTFGDQHKSFRYYVEPSSDPKDRRDPDVSTSRGWAWLEFGRRTVDGPRYFTLLLYAQAKRGSQQFARTWAVSEGTSRVRDGLWLTVGSAVPSPDDVGPELEVFRTGADYRAAVTKRLWGYGRADRLEAVVRILKVLRTPHLGQRLDPDFFTEQMRDALPALDPAEIEKLAEGWDQLERLAVDRDQAVEALQTVRAFVRRSWEPWADRVLRRYADALVAANRRFDDVTRDEREATAAKDAAAGEVDRLNSAIASTAGERDTANLRYELHLKSPAYQEASAAVDRAGRLREAAGEAAKRHKSSTRVHVDAMAAATDRAGERNDASDLLAQDRQSMEEAAGLLQQAALPVRFGSGFADWATACDLPRLVGAVRRRQADVAAVRSRAEEHKTATAALARSADQLAGREGAHRERERDRIAADTGVEHELQWLSDRIEAWSREQRDDAPDRTVRDRWAAALTELARTELPASVLPDLVRVHWLEPLIGPVTERATVLAQQAGDAEAEADRLEAEVQQITVEREPTPSPPTRWRRRDRPAPGPGGAPFWRLLDPVPDCASAELGVVEAALDAMGLLEAWVTRDGAWRSERDGADLVLSPLDLPSRPIDRVGTDTLTRVLQPAGETGDPLTLPARRALAAINFLPAGDLLPVATELSAGANQPDSEHHSGDELTGPDNPHSQPIRPYALSADGRWQTPMTTGRVVPAEHGAELIGTAARAAARARRLAELRTAVATARAKAESAALEASRLRDRADAWRQAARALGDDATLVRLRGDALRATREVEQAAAYLLEAQDAHRQAETRVGTAWADLLTVASERDLPHDQHGLAMVDIAINATEVAFERFRGAVATVARSEPALAAAGERLTEAEAAVRTAADAEKSARREAADALLAADEAERALADPERDQLAEAARLQQARNNLATTLAQLEEAAQIGAGVEGRAAEKLAGITRAREEAVHAREQALRDWGRPVRAGLATDRGLDVSGPSSLTAAISQAQSARRDLQPRDWPSADDPVGKQALVDQAWSRMVGNPLIELRTMLERSGGRTVAVVEAEGDELPAVAVVVDSLGDRCGPIVAAQRLQTQVQELSAAYDRRLTEQLTELLASTFVEHLRYRLETVLKLIISVNRVLAAHPTGATQTTLRLRRVPAAEHADGFAVLTALEGSVIEGSTAQQQVRDFLERVIRQAQDEGRSRNVDWKERLADLLDYRAWFAVITEYRAHSEVATFAGSSAGDAVRAAWRPLTKQVHGQDSGGGKAVTLLQPLLATLVALYDEVPGAPRPLWLDEAFTGVDDANRAVMLDLLVAFDLDFLLAGPAALVAVRQVPAAAIWFVTRASAPAPGVDLSLALWAGNRQVNIPVPDLLDLSSRPLALTDSLFEVATDASSASDLEEADR